VFDLLNYSDGAVVISEGIVDEHLLILQTGTVVISKDGTEVARISEKGTFIGKISAILGEKRNCTVTASGECDILKLDQTIDELIAENPRLVKKLLQELPTRLAAATDTLVQSQHSLITFREQG
jgi:CRP-like cAMP-binding protein|tara:strand:- start:2932 stop:3303 length:372 start_codon:yes stop_codon:yes gene_type:complete